MSWKPTHNGLTPEFGVENVGHCVLIWQALYGGKVAGADF